MTIHIAMAVESLLYFPLYLLKYAGADYGLKDISIELETFSGDSEAYNVFSNEEKYHFFVGDPLMGVDDLLGDSHLLFPLVTSTSLWMISEEKQKIRYYTDFDNQGIERIYTAGIGYSSHKIFNYIKTKEDSSFELRVYNSAHQEFSNMDKKNISITSNILASKYAKKSVPLLNISPVLTINDENFKNNLFTAVISKPLVDSYIKEKISKSLFKIFRRFQEENERKKMAKILYAHHAEMKVLDTVVLDAMLDDYLAQKDEYLDKKSINLAELYEESLEELYQFKVYPQNLAFIKRHIFEYWQKSERLNYKNHLRKREDIYYQRRVKDFFKLEDMNEILEEKLGNFSLREFPEKKDFTYKEEYASLN